MDGRMKELLQSETQEQKCSVQPMNTCGLQSYQVNKSVSIQIKKSVKHQTKIKLIISPEP